MNACTRVKEASNEIRRSISNLSIIWSLLSKFITMVLRNIHITMASVSIVAVYHSDHRLIIFGRMADKAFGIAAVTAVLTCASGLNIMMYNVACYVYCPKLY